jgi:RNA polymerase sigma factor (sigma-70 family)
MSEREIVRRILAGEVDLYEKLYRPWLGPAFSCAYAILADVDKAQTVAHDALSAAFEELARFDPRRKFGAWALGIARNMARSRRRYARWRCRPRSMDELTAGEEPSSAGPGARTDGEFDDWPFITRLRQELPARDMQFLTWCFVQGLGNAEIAQLTGQTPDVVAVRKHRILKRARRILAATEQGGACRPETS